MDKNKIKQFAKLIKVSNNIVFFGVTSLAVYPAASFIRYFSGNKIVLINRDETQYDNVATLVFRDSIGEVLSETVSLL